LQAVITKVGTATLMTNLTTAAGFATFIITSSDILREFGLFLRLVLLLYFSLFDCHTNLLQLSACTKAKHLEHLNRNYTKIFITWIEKNSKIRSALCIVAVFLF
jgi:predicted RND superfamily exporter protein